MAEQSNWTVYIIETESGKLYTGITKDLEQRFAAHRDKPTGARFFRTSRPKKVVYIEELPNRSEATKREIAIKKLTRKQKMQLIRKKKNS
jgi:putative endonuclease